MTRYYKSATGALYHHTVTHGTETHNFPATLDRSTLTEISKEEHDSLLLHQRYASDQKRAQAIELRKEHHLADLKVAYDELRALGMSDRSARSVSGYYGP